MAANCSLSEETCIVTCWFLGFQTLIVEMVKSLKKCIDNALVFSNVKKFDLFSFFLSSSCHSWENFCCFLRTILCFWEEFLAFCAFSKRFKSLAHTLMYSIILSTWGVLVWGYGGQDGVFVIPQDLEKEGT